MVVIGTVARVVMSTLDLSLVVLLLVVAILGARAQRRARSAFDAAPGSPRSRYDEGVEHFLLPGLAVGIGVIVWFVGAMLVVLGDPSNARLLGYATYVPVLGAAFSWSYSSFRAHAFGRSPTAASLARFFVQEWVQRLVPWALVIGLVLLSMRVYAPEGTVEEGSVVVLAAAIGLAGSFALLPHLIRWIAGARPVTDPQLLDMLAELNRVAGTAVTRLYVMPFRDETLNAMVTGLSRKRPTIFVTEALIRLLPGRSVKAILAHELAHVREGHILKSLGDNVLGLIVRMVLITGSWALIERFYGAPSPLVTVGILFGAHVLVEVGGTLPLGRRREAQADALAAAWVGGEELAEALEKLYSADLTSGNESKVEELCQSHPALRSRVVNLRRV
jgi:heat shock protein HtpX